MYRHLRPEYIEVSSLRWVVAVEVTYIDLNFALSRLGAAHTTYLIMVQLIRLLTPYEPVCTLRFTTVSNNKKHTTIVPKENILALIITPE